MNVPVQDIQIAKASHARQQGVTTAAAGTQMGDGFDAIFQNMMLSASLSMNMGEGGLLGLLEGGEGMFAQTDLEKEGQMDAGMMELLASLFLQNPQIAQFFQQDDAAASQTLSALSIPADAKQLLLNLRTAVQEGQNPFAAQDTQALPSQSQTVTAANTDNSSAFSQILSQGQAAATAQTGEGDGLSGLQDNFLQTIREAKALLNAAAKGQAQEEIPLDVDQLQSDVQSNRFNPLADVSRTASSQSLEQYQPVDKQIETGVAENLLQGKQEFTIKLKPEGLGEITVKLLEKPGEATVLSLITASADAAKLINERLHALQEAMRPLQVQVTQAMPQNVESSQAGSQSDLSQQFLMFNQQQGQQQSGSQASRQTQGGFSGAADSNAALEEELPLTIQTDGLDTYI